MSGHWKHMMLPLVVSKCKKVYMKVVGGGRHWTCILLEESNIGA